MLRWTERKFDFNFPAGMWPVILERLRGTVPHIEHMLKDVPEKILAQKNGDAWSIKEHIGHLTDLEELHTGRIDDYLAGLAILRAADMTNRKTYEANHNKRSIDELISEFRISRNQFLQKLQKLSPEQTSIHPRLQQPMRVVDMAFFVAEHEDHHLAIVRALIESGSGITD